MADQLIDCTTFSINRLNTSDKLNCVVRIHANSKCLSMSISIFQSLLCLLTEVNFQKPKPFLSEQFKITVSTRSRRIFIIKCLLNDQCVHLNGENILHLLRIRNDIHELTIAKHNLVRPVLLKISHIIDFIKLMPKCKTRNLNEEEDCLKRIDPAHIRAGIPTGNVDLLEEQLRILLSYFSKEFAEIWLSYSIERETVVGRPHTRAYLRQEMLKTNTGEVNNKKSDMVK
ncbi:hypothetical protein AGLY_014057 [Aphis glycines]|uniref:Uncharacterized protein n=1 Tax=Aphis glycines TaxID=307491 RepID=A0A6G0T6R1_APHGL|nr:hypothetical protein AGLY_014057 [Aphis glycines]